jgi:hypothetical protein
MARTLLDYTQTIMDDMGSDSVNSISDSLESQRVANIVKRTFFDLAVEMDLPTAEELFVLTALADTTMPTHMRIPDNVYSLGWIKYDQKTGPADTRIRYGEIWYLEPEEFFMRISTRNSDDSNQQVVEDPTNINLIIQTDQNPTYWTSFDGENVVFDSFDNTVSTTIEASKVVCHGRVGKSWTHENTHIPDIPEHLEPTLLAIAEERAFAFVKQQENSVSKDNARRYRIHGKSDKDRINRKVTPYPNFGRPGRPRGFPRSTK